ncbi:MAG: amino acid permease [Actinomycetaceae bacterium]|nr:amino acid permease [Actinomycetaceae bacterium]
MSATKAPEIDKPDLQHGLKRRLTSPQVAMIALSGALGTGLFLGSSKTIALAGPATVVSFILSGLCALAVVWALAEVVTVHPVPGGHGAVAASYLGPLAGYIARWNFAVTMMLAVGAEVVASATYLRYWFPDLPLWLGTALCSSVIVVLNLASVHLYGTSEYWFSMIKVTAIIVFIVLGFYLIFFGTDATEPVGWGNLTQHDGFAPYGIMGVLSAAVIAVFSFGGIENVSVAAAESQNPRRDVPRAAHTMIWRLLIFYVFAITVVVTLQPWTQTASSDGSIDKSPFVSVLEILGVSAAANIMNAILLIAALSAANGCLYTASRMIHSLAGDNLAPRIAERTNAKGAPRTAVLFATVGMFAAAAVALFAPGEAFGWFMGVATIGILVTWVMSMLTVMAFRKRREELGLPHSPARLWLVPVIPWLIIAVSIAVYLALFKLSFPAFVMGMIYVPTLLISFQILKRMGKVKEPVNLAALELQELTEARIQDRAQVSGDSKS